MAPALEEFLQLLRESIEGRTLSKLTLGGYRGADSTLRHLYVRPVDLRAGLQLSFVWRHATRDITKNHPVPEAIDLLAGLIGSDFRSAHLFTTAGGAQIEFADDGSARLKRLPNLASAPPSGRHDRAKRRPIPAGASWMQALGITNASGAPRGEMAAKFKQINRYTELLAPLIDDAPLPADHPIQVADMGSGKGYLTFAVWELLRNVVRRPAHIRGIEQRPELVDLCNRTARQCGCDGLEFTAETIADTPAAGIDVLIALHACDTATDDALARGIGAGASLIVAAPCCHRELSPQLQAPPVLAPALRQGIFHERQAEFVTDALRTLLLEWAGYQTRAFEFISTEHTPKNLMIAGVRRTGPCDRDAAAARVRALAAAYGIQHQRLAGLLGITLA